MMWCQNYVQLSNNILAAVLEMESIRLTPNTEPDILMQFFVLKVTITQVGPG